MAACGEDTRIVVPFKPTLFPMSLATLAVRLCNEFGIERVKDVFAEIQSGKVPECEEGLGNYPIFRSRVKETLLRIPTLLRSRVLAAVERVEYVVSQWMNHHRNIDRLDSTKVLLFWRSDGTIDRTKTAQEISENQNVDITARFEISCMYWLANQVQTLWAALKKNGEREKYERHLRFGMVPQMVFFWVEWLIRGAQVPWTQAVQEYLFTGMFAGSKNVLPSSHFRMLMPGERRIFPRRLGYLCKADDLRFCLYAMTNEEQLVAMQDFASDVLELYMNWPLAGNFLEIAEKAWDFLHEYSFCIVLENLLERRCRTDFDFEYLVKEFWKMSPTHFKEYAKKSASKHVFKELNIMIEQVQSD